MPPFPPAVRITAARMLRRLTRAELARKASIQTCQLHRYETGYSTPSFHSLRALTLALQCDASLFLDTPSHTPPPPGWEGALVAVQKLVDLSCDYVEEPYRLTAEVWGQIPFHPLEEAATP